MPYAAKKPCSKAGCRGYAAKDGRCYEHRREPWASNKGKTPTSRGYGAKWVKLRAMILLRDEYLCKPCQHEGYLTKATQVDHIKYKARGCTGDHSNLQAICEPCHKRKTRKEAQSGK